MLSFIFLCVFSFDFYTNFHFSLVPKMKTDATKRIFLNAQLRKTTFKCFYLARTQFGRQLWGYIIIDLSIGISVNTFFLFFFCVAFFYATYDSHDKFSDIQYFNTDFRFQIVNLS